MWEYNRTDELYHYGVLGMKWGKRKNNSEISENKGKLHLGLDNRGNINLIRGTTTKKAKTAFAIKSVLLIASLSTTIYLAKHPYAIEKGAKAVNNIFKKSKNISIKPVTSGIFSQQLGRELTIAEAFGAGFDLSD